MRRSGWKRGDHLVQDEESGFIEYASNVGRDFFGVLKKKSQMDEIHPQMYTPALRDPAIVTPINPPNRSYDFSQSLVGSTIGSSGVTRPTSPASHLFQQGIGKMIIEFDFIVS